MRVIPICFCLLLCTSAARAIDAEHHAKGKQLARNASTYLRAQQDEPTGGWRHAEDRPNFPAVSALVLSGLLMDPAIDQNDRGVARGIEYVLSYAHADGGIHDGLLPSYNTAICLSMLARVRTPEASTAIIRGQGFLKGLQYHEGYAGSAESPGFNEPVPQSHPYYGGVGYGRHGRPDLSNVGFFLQAMHDTGLSTEDEAYQRALKFLSRVQMLDETNDMPYADGSSQGGFIYATVPNRDSIDGRAGQSQAGFIEESSPDGVPSPRLRAYGSMSYVGFKSLIYADLPRDDPRVVGVLGWIESNFTLGENPGLGAQGQYYTYLALARALDAWGEPAIAGQDWREALIDQLATLQQPDGSFAPLADRWMEGDPVLITSYSLIALQIALGNN